MGKGKGNRVGDNNCSEGRFCSGMRLLCTAKSLKWYLYDDKGVVPVTDLLVLDRLLLVEDIHSVEPLSAVHEMIFGDEERQPVDGRDIKHIFESLVVLVVVGRHLSDVRTEESHIKLHSVSLCLLRLVMEKVAAVTLHLRDQQRKIVSLELVRREYLCSCTVKVVVFLPRRFPLTDCLVSVEGKVLVDEIPLSIYLVILVNVAEIVLTRQENDGHVGLSAGDVGIVESNEGGSRRVTTEGRR